MSGGSSDVIALATLPNGDLVAGGWFTMAGGLVSAHLARLTTTCPAAANSTAPGCPSSGGANTLTAENLPWTGSTFRATGTGLPLSGLVAIVTGFSTGSLPLSTVLPQGQPGCTLAVSPDLVDFVLPTAGAATARTPLLNTPSLAGIVFHQQMIPLEVDAAWNVTAVTATNALAMTVGSF